MYPILANNKSPVLDINQFVKMCYNRITMLARIKHPHYVVLSIILLFNAYLRLWGITHLFYWLSDYDDGAYSLGGKLISQGYLPYKDFVLVHPPLYDMALAAIYKVFGYNFFYGRYFSVTLSFACLILVYLIVRKFYNPTAGLVAALLFTIFPGFDLLWYRVVQEPLGIFLVLLALFFAADYIKSRENRSHLLFSGLCLGLAVTTKYTFAPAVIGFAVGIWVLSTEWNRRNFKSNFSGLIKRDIWMLIAGITAGFLLVTGFFIIKYPQAFFSQTISSQVAYRGGNNLDYIINQLRQLPTGIRDIFLLIKGSFENTIMMVCVLVGIALLITLFFKRKRSNADIFLLVAALICLPLCSLFNPFGEMKYFASFYVFLLLAIVTFIPEMNLHTATNAGSVIVTVSMLVFLGGTIALRMNYNFLNSARMTYEEQSYKDTINYLESIGAKKVYTMSPIIIALAPNLNPTPLFFDTFGNLIIMKDSPTAFYQNVLDSGVDYAVIDQSALLSISPGSQSIGGVSMQIRAKGTEVQSFVPNGVGILGTSVFKVVRP